MPELAEVEFFRRRWSQGHGERIVAVDLSARAKVFRGSNPLRLRRTLVGARLVDSETAAKQMLFRFDFAPPGRRQAKAWLGIHLGMSGELRVESPDYTPRKHDHLVLRQRKRALVFNDPRMFGAVRFEVSPQPPLWWTRIAPAILSPKFTLAAVADFLRRRGRAPIKAVLLMQERFPGVGNWMADEILWRAGIHPRRLAGSLSPTEVRALHRECRNVCRQALDKIAGRGGKLPPDLNVHIPKSWLFWHRWEDGGRCPRTGVPLVREEIGGRTTCWSPARQSSARRARCHVIRDNLAPPLLLWRMPAKQRLDELLVARGICATRSQAKALIMTGRVRHGTERLEKPGKEYPFDYELSIEQLPRFVGRGGEKLAAWLKRFPLDLSGAHVLDVGASTGGFTDCALQAGAASATCVDVGFGQLHEKLRRDPRVTNKEKLNARHLTAADLPRAEYDAIVMDLSFISLKSVLPAVWPFLRPGGTLVALVKPQFEAGKAEVDKGAGVIRDDAVRARVLAEVREFALRELPGASLVGEMESPLHGADGNREFLLGLRRST